MDEVGKAYVALVVEDINIAALEGRVLELEETHQLESDEVLYTVRVKMA